MRNAPSYLVAACAVAAAFSGCGTQSGRDANRDSSASETTSEATAAPLAGVGRTVSADGLEVVYEVFGDPSSVPPLVLVHGWSSNRDFWGGQAGPLSKRYRVVTVDLAGHGDSGMGRRRWTIASFGADVAAVLDALDLRGAILVGHSMGGDVILDAARDAPERVQGLVWIDDYRQLERPQPAETILDLVGSIEEDSEGFIYSFVRENLFHPDTDPALIERVARAMSTTPTEIAAQSVRSSFQNGHMVPVMLETELELPIVAINPDDGSTDVASLQRYGVEVELLPDVGHFLMMEDPTGFNALLVDVVETMIR